ncbi:MAG: phenylalanine--tRNA ligase subunit alpha [Candidatus Spechtbacteria bacterium RIFCSPHIGHO2_02_FULL_43_15b]|nr:MAG: phenylalanine--tRNA ligase subunit alpha [Candidatus Spechtbacteria bacterium RIFCSPHIGHO2_02_FULL_43_15b]
MDIGEIKKEILSKSNLKELDAAHKKYLGKNGSLNVELKALKDLPPDERKAKAPELQRLKREIDAAVVERAGYLKRKEIESSLESEIIDITAPGVKIEMGHIHPLTKVQDRMNEIFTSLGFEIVEGPEVETEWYNFDALNIPEDHPARDMWDTFWLAPENRESETKNQNLLLRTHTSPVQIRYMETHHSPLRIITSGRVFRHEASDASHDIQFHQLEGLMVDKNITVANFKAVIGEFLKGLFAGKVQTRLRPAYFPFVEPGFEVMMSCANCDAKGCPVCSKTGWLEVMGAGMVHPNVFKAVGYDVNEVQGFAFGIGIDRIAMMKYKIDDIRLFYGGDLKFLRQF